MVCFRVHRNEGVLGARGLLEGIAEIVGPQDTMWYTGNQLAYGPKFGFMLSHLLVEWS